MPKPPIKMNVVTYVLLPLPMTVLVRTHMTGETVLEATNTNPVEVAKDIVAARQAIEGALRQAVVDLGQA